MSAQALEHLLAVLYTDEAVRAEFMQDALAVARRFGLDAREAAAVSHVDLDALALAARSYAAKRAAHARTRKPDS